MEIIQLHYNVLVAGHKEKWKTTELVMRNYWQPEVKKDIEKYVSEDEEQDRIASRKAEVE